VIAAGPPAVTDTEPVHQMRVALRRLRACLSAFRHATDTPAMRALNEDARQLSGLLGPARDWDVFIAETGAAVAMAIGDDPALGRLLDRAARRRRAAYAALRRYLAGAAFRRMGIRLAGMAGGTGWRAALAPDQQAALASDIRDFAGTVMDRRLKRVRRAGERIDGLEEAALHGIRLDGKRLRYAAEIFAPLFERKKVARFQRRLMELQERLGKLNDGAVTADLMAQLMGTGRAGGKRAYAAGIVRGFVAAGGAAARADIERAWERFHRAKPFW
jgi:triphosphatase